MKSRSAKWHTIYSIISTIIETASLAAIILWLLPLIGIAIPCWGTALILLVFLIYSYIMYRIGHPTILQQSVAAPESIIGNSGIVEVDLKPEGYVRVRGELWKASCSSGILLKGEEITVTAMDGMKLMVERKA